MPRETVKDPVGPYNVQVGWERDRSVQVGVSLDHTDTSLLRALFGDADTVIRAGQALQQQATELRKLLDDYERTESMPSRDDDPLSRDEHLLVICSRLGELAIAAYDNLEVGINDAGAFDTRYRGIWTHPNRYTINELIRVLRRARDQAFGRDE